MNLFISLPDRIVVPTEHIPFDTRSQRLRYHIGCLIRPYSKTHPRITHLIRSIVMAARTEHVTAKLEPAIKEQLQAECASRNMKMSELLSSIVVKHLTAANAKK
jgi:hypothetical protein